MQKLPFLQYSTFGQPSEEGFETWRQLMSPMYEIKPVENTGTRPGGSTILYQLGDILANRAFFSAQMLKRDKKRIDATPDHILFQFWRAGGFVGKLGGHSVTLSPGSIAIADRRRSVEGIVGRADMLGIILPRELLLGLDIEAYGLKLDPARDRLMVARITALYRQLPHTDLADVDALARELTGFVRRLLDRSPARDVLEGAELDQGLLPLARNAILADLSRRDLTPESVAAATGVSRATLYRMFRPFGGVMNCVAEQRLLAVRDALADPVETRSLTRLASDYAVGSPSQLSRSFHARFGCSPRAYRAQQRAILRARGDDPAGAFTAWFEDLGR